MSELDHGMYEHHPDIHPPKQGLKLVYSAIDPIAVKHPDIHPPKQGLKLLICLTIIKDYMASRHTSTKTRIETQQRKVLQTLLSHPDIHPSKQGLKRRGPGACPYRWWSSRHTSIKTRIETYISKPQPLTGTDIQTYIHQNKD